ncbi:MAG: hypothetical protein WCI61_06420, partial [Chloroflexota bacterium]
MPDEETPRTPEDGAPAPEPPPDAAGAASGGWASPAADLTTPVDPAAAGPASAPRRFPPEPQVFRPASQRPEPPPAAELPSEPPATGGWFGRLRSLVQRGDARNEPPPATAPWRSPSAAEEHAAPSTASTPPAAAFEAPARPSLSDATPGIDAPHVDEDASAPAATPRSSAPGAAWRFGQFGGTTPPPADPSPPTEAQPEPVAEPEAAPEVAAAAEPVGELILDAAVETDADSGEPEDAQPSLFHTAPAEPQPVIDDLEPLPSLEVVAQAIEDALQEAESVIEQPPA